MKPVRIVLASGSPRRKEILRELKLEFEARPSDVDETLLKGETVTDAAERLALAKADAVATGNRDALVIGADSLVTIDHMVLGKPDGPEDGRRMLRMLSGKTHEVVTGLAFVLRDEGLREVAVGRSSVTFRHLSDGDVDAYLADGEYIDKAGAYAIQGKGGEFVESHSGSFSNVVGFPVTEFLRFAISFGTDRLPWILD